MSNYEFVITYEQDVKNINDWFDDKAIEFPIVHLNGEKINKKLWSYKPTAIIFSSVQNRPLPMILLLEARIRKITTITVEESIQMALNDGRVNNYLFPVDYTAWGSEYEMEESLKLGLVNGENRVTGWPFYHQEEKPQTVRAIKQELGLSEESKVISLAFPGLFSGNETEVVRKKQLSIASEIIRNDENIQLLIKPHPVEKRDPLNQWIDEIFQNNRDRVFLIDGSVSIEKIIKVSDFMLNRGASQTFFECLINKVPVIFLDVGQKCIFYKYAKDSVFTDVSDITKFINNYNASSFGVYYQKLTQKFLPHNPTVALENVVHLIKQAIVKGPQEIPHFGEIMSFCLEYRLLNKAAKKSLKAFPSRKEFTQLYKKFNKRTSLSFNEWKVFLNEWKNTIYFQFIFSNFIRQIANEKLIDKLPNEWVDYSMYFPSKVHAIWFYWAVEKTLYALSKTNTKNLKRYLQKNEFLKLENEKFNQLLNQYEKIAY